LAARWERAIATFYLTDLTEDRITNVGRLRTLEKRLLAAAAGEELDLAA
jgi:[protein-PII] uridylyltransferase